MKQGPGLMRPTILMQKIIFLMFSSFLMFVIILDSAFLPLLCPVCHCSKTLLVKEGKSTRNDISDKSMTKITLQPSSDLTLPSLSPTSSQRESDLTDIDHLSTHVPCTLKKFFDFSTAHLEWDMLQGVRHLTTMRSGWHWPGKWWAVHKLHHFWLI